MKPFVAAYYLITFFYFLVAGRVFTQSYISHIQHFSVEDGLSSRFVNEGVQDDRGFMWLATDYGLNRFDGNTFRIFNTAEGLRNENCKNLYKGPDGKLWIFYFSGKTDILDPLTEAIVPLESLVPELTGKELEGLGSTPDHELILLKDSTHLWAYDGTFQKFEIPGAFLSMPPHLQYIFVSPWHTVLVQMPDGLTEYDLRGNLIRQHPGLKRIYTSSHLGDSTLFITAYSTPPNGLKIYKLTSGAPPSEFRQKVNGSPLPYSIENSTDLTNHYFFQDKNKNIWEVSPNRFAVFDAEGNLIESFTQKSNLECDHSFPKQLFSDTENNIWLLTYNGVYIISSSRHLFRKYLQKNPRISVRGIEKYDSTHLLAATYDGLYLIDQKSGQDKKLTSQPFYGLKKLPDGSFLAGEHSNNASRLFFRNGDLQIEKIPLHEKRRFGTPLRPFADPYTGTYWFGMEQGLSYLDPATYSLLNFNQVNGFGIFHNLQINHCHFKESDIWVATSNGVFRIDRDQGIMEWFNEFPNNLIAHLHEDEDGSFWLSTRGGGLLHWDRKRGTIEQFNVRKGLSHDIIYAAYDDGAGHLWLPSNYGLMRFEKATGFVHNFLPQDGITHVEFNATSHFRDTDGSFYFGGLNGITAFHPGDITFQQKNTPLVVTSFQQLENSGQLADRTQELLTNPQIVLNPGDEFFSIEFTLLDYNSGRHMYGWKLDGLNKEWTYQSENRLRFNALPYGRYTLRIKAQGRGAHWSKNELEIPVRVIRPFYLQAPFVFAMTGIIALLVYLIFHLRLRNLRQEKQRLESIVSQRTSELVAKNEELATLNDIKDRFFAIIAHDLRSPIVSLGGLSRKITYLIRKNRTDEIPALGQTVDQAVSGVQMLLDNLLNWAMVQEGKFPYHPEQVFIEDILRDIARIYKHVAESKNIRLQTSAEPGLTAYCDRNALSTIVRNLVDNAIKFSPENGKVTVQAFSANHQVIIRIKDSGKGIPADLKKQLFELRGQKGDSGTRGEKGTGLGLVLCRELVEMNKGKIQVESEKEAGTVFIVQLPENVPTSAS